MARLDALMSLSIVAQQSGYCRPTLVSDPVIYGTALRHPIVESVLGTAFVPNDIHIAFEYQRHWIISGPNMGGKSVFVKQIALIVLMAHMGSYVPAASFTCGIFDMVCFRSGTSDHLLQGMSTFMVEMQETAHILKTATCQSLVVFDELGQGTATYDGCAIAYSVLDHLVRNIQCVTLFVTHYPQLDDLATLYQPLIQTAHMSYIETNQRQNTTTAESHLSITFLFKLKYGMAKRSYGLNVARLARLPETILKCAAQVSSRMERQHIAFRNLYNALLSANPHQHKWPP